MKRVLFSAAALALTAGAALAADLPSRKAEPFLPPPPPPPPLWTGFYAGLNAGYNWGTNQNANAAALTYPNNYTEWGPDYVNDGYPIVPLQGVGLAQSGSIANTQSGFIGGGQIGYNYQYGSNIVLGVEADIQGTNTRGSGRTGGANVIDSNNFYTYQDQVSSVGGTALQAGVDWLGTVRGRVGYLFTPTLLTYVTGGFAYGGAYANVVQTGTAVGVQEPYGNTYGTFTQGYQGGGHANKVLTGYSVGGGLEWMFMPNWSLKAEAIYWNLGNSSVTTASFAPAGYYYSSDYPMAASSTIGRVNVNYQGVTARAGVNYHFNWGAAAPVVAKY
jgi:outer membrane immunogenic protein